MATIEVTVNGERSRVDVRDHWTLLDLLRDEMDITGTKDGCSEGVCGACSVLVDGRLVRACLTLARRVEGCRITTVEGLSNGESLSALQQAFIDHGAVQCGFCTSGMLIAATVLLETHPDPTDGEIREHLAGNLCRCTGYVKIFAAIKAAARGRPAAAQM